MRDNFKKEKLLTLIVPVGLVCADFFATLACCFLYLETKITEYPLIVIVLLSTILGAIGLFCISIIVNSPKICVDTESLQFEYDGKTYDFSELLPTYSVVNSAFIMIKPHVTVTLQLYFKDGTSEKLCMPNFVAMQFATKYLNKYSKPDMNVLTWW